MLVKVITFGCKVNQFESQAIIEALRRAGHQIAGPRDGMDICIVNTCAVTARAAYEARQAIRRVLRRHPGARIIVTGCYAQTDPWGLMESIDTNICVIGNDQKERLLNPKFSSMDCLEIYVGDILKKKNITPFSLHSPQGRTRAYLKIQDGCSAFCSYCIVPYARGPSRSLPVEEVLEQAKRYEEAGVREIVVTGIHVGFYGRDLEDAVSLVDILDTLTSRFKGCRFRLSSLEPGELTDDIIALAAERENFCPHFHIPLQSGSSKVLKSMGRRYTPEEFIERVNVLRERLPDAAIGTDCMVGYPGEEEADFEMTCEVIKGSPITYLHVFPYSRRPGTRAAGMKETVTKREKERRARALRAIGEEKKVAFYRQFLGTTIEILAERVDRKRGTVQGTSANYLQAVARLKVKAQTPQPNQIVKLVAKSIEDQKIFGEMIS